MMTTFETKGVDFVVISLINYRLRLVGFGSYLIELGLLKLMLFAKDVNLELFKLWSQIDILSLAMGGNVLKERAM